MAKSEDSMWPLFLASVPVLLLIGSVITNGVRADESSFYIYEVPYASQKHAYWCGPASLTIVLKYWGLNVTQEEIAAQTYNPETKLTNISIMKSYPLRCGFRSEELNGSIDCLRKWIRKGCPIIVLQKLSLQDVYGHYRVVVGYDNEKDLVMTFDPILGPNYNMTYSEFAELWMPGTTFQTCNWTLLVIPKDEILIEQAERRQLLSTKCYHP